jgi:hypothetical protein
MSKYCPTCTEQVIYGENPPNLNFCVKQKHPNRRLPRAPHGTGGGGSFILMEDSGYILLESGGKIRIE